MYKTFTFICTGGFFLPSLALSFFLFLLKPLGFFFFSDVFCMKHLPLEILSARHKTQDFDHLENVISSVSIHLASEPIRLHLYMRFPSKNTFKLAL